VTLVKNALQLASTDRLSVFLFHKVPSVADPLVPKDLDASRFEVVLDFIKSNFNVLPLAEAVGRLHTKTLPRSCAAITFDDGYAEWRNGIAVMLEKRSLPATLYITTGQFEGRPMWHERLANVVRRHQGATLDTTMIRLPSLKTGTLPEKVEALQVLEFHFKYLPLVVRDHFLQRLEASVGAVMSEVESMKKEDLIHISNRGFEIGAHTLDHPILSLCDAERARREIGETREVLEGITKRPIHSFAYPNGRPGTDFSHRHIEMVRAAGYRYAVTTQWGVANHASSPFQIPRFTPWGPSRGQMTFQLLRNLLARPVALKEST
jgi:peptidoglycan/xylan/chitin deacetylase (PgdA/CDA1 family)